MKEIDRLARMLDKAGIPYRRRASFIGSPDFGGRYLQDQIIYPDWDEFGVSVIQGEHTFGGKLNLLEMMASPSEVEGYLSAEAVFEKISLDWEENRKRVP